MAQEWENLSDPIFHYAQARPQAVAISDGNEALDYRALASLVARAGVYLRDHGIGEGDRIGIALTNSADHVILLFALLRIGATPVELSSDDNIDTVAAIAAKYGIRTIFAEAHAAPIAGVRQIPVGLYWRREIEGKTGDHRSAAGGDRHRVIALTTGSTGVPAGWMLTQTHVMQRAATFAMRLPPRAREIDTPSHMLVTMSLRYIWMIANIAFQVGAGDVVVLLPDFTQGPDLLRALAAWDDAIISVTPSICRYLLRAAPETGLLLPRVLSFEVGGLPLHGDEKRAVIERITPNLFEAYGTTAAGAITRLVPADILRKPNSVGAPLTGTVVEIVDARGESLPADTIGEIRCKPPSSLGLCAEDERHGAERVERIEGGWCYTGDMGCLDPDGYLYIKGRTVDFIRREGTEFFASEIEAVIASYPAVAETAVVALPSPARGEEIIAFVVKHGALDHDELGRYCRARLAPERLPDRVFYIDSLPRIAGQKPDRLRLQALAAAEIARKSA